MPNPTLRTLSLISAALLGLLALAVVIALVRLSDQAAEAIAVTERDTRSMAIGDEIEQRLLTYSRLSNLLIASADPALGTLRAETEQAFRGLLAEAARYSAGTGEDALLARLSRLIEAYLSVRRRLEEQGLSLRATISAATPHLEACLDELDALQRLNDAQLVQAHQATLRLQRLSALMGAGITGVLLVVLTLGLFGARAYLVRPIVELYRTVERFRSGDASARAAPAGPPEIGRIALEFNLMAEALARQRRDQLAFLAGVAHDLKNPLAAMQLSVQAMARTAKGRGPREPPGAMALLDRQLERLTRMVDDLLEAARIEAGELVLQPEEVDLRATVRETAALYQASCKGHRIVEHLPDRPVLVQADPLRLEQALGNLLSNAIKYSRPGSTIDVSAETQGSTARLSVCDQGIGIPSEAIPDLFTPFRRHGSASQLVAGAGLGLSVVRRIVEAHGGTVEVESVPGQGSVFRLRLPALQATAPGCGPGPAAAGDSGGPDANGAL